MKVSELELIEIKKLYVEDELSASKIAKLYSLTPNTVIKYLNNMGVKVENKLNKLEFDLEKDIIPLVNKEVSLTLIAKQFNTTVLTLSRHLKKAGYEVINHQNKTKFNENIFDSIDTEEKAYWLGFIFADGYIDSSPLDPNKKSRYQFELSLKGSDFEHLVKFNTFMEHNKNNVKISNTKCGEKICQRCRWSVTNKHLWETLNNLGCTPQKSLTLEFPDESIFKDKSLIKHFIRGYFDGDGCLGYTITNDKVYPLLTFLGTLEFLEKIRSFLLENNIECNSLHQNSSSLDITLVLQIKRKDTISFLNLIYQNSSVYLNRKFYRYNLFKNCRSSEQLLELLRGNIGEGCDANTEITEETKESSVLLSIGIETL